MSIKIFFTARKVEMSDFSELWEVVTPLGERVASAGSEILMREMEETLNLSLTDAADADADVVICD